MKIDISAVVKTAGAKLEINESGIIDDLKDVYGGIRVAEPVAFKGILVNINGLLYLKGKTECKYKTQCDFCAAPLEETINVMIEEVLAEAKQARELSIDEDHYFYQGNCLLLDKILSDSIMLAFPMHHRCRQNCAVICPKCGKPVTGKACGCADDQPIDPRLAALKELYDHQHADTAE